MKQLLFFFILFSLVACGYWGYTYSRIDANTRGSFVLYVREDAVEKFQRTLQAIKDAPQMSAELIESKGHAENALLKQLESAVSAYYATEGHYPENLNDIANTKNLPESILIKYELNTAGYTISLYNKSGVLLKEVSHGF